MKIKAIATSTDLPSELSKPVAFPRDAASLNVHGRLCKSNPVQEAFPAAIAAVKREFGIRDDPGITAKKKRLRAKDYEAVRATSVGSDGSSHADKPPKKLKKTRGDDRDTGSWSELDEGGEGSEDEFEHYQDRLASSGDEEGSEDEDMEISDVEQLERQLEQEGLPRKLNPPKPQRYDPAADLSLSEEESEDESIDERPSRKGAVAKPNKSSFIPSLTMGGYISGSGSDIDDVDVAPRKNRRGQRARQKIWEQKYKSKANHLKNQERDGGWDPKRGAVGGSQRQPRFAKGANSMPVENRRRNVGASDTKGPTSETKKKPARKDDTGPLHPSWEAAKRAKEKRDAPVPFQGKKISFD